MLDDWTALAVQIRDFGFRVEENVEAAPVSSIGPETARVVLPRGIDLPDRDDAILPVSTGDLLGLFTHGVWKIPEGIHLFCDRIRSEAPQVGIGAAELGMYVFLHEVTHCHVYCAGTPTPKAAWLRPYDLEEVICESFAYHALKTGRYAPLDWDTLRLPCFWKLSRWRRRDMLYPYSWFPNCALDISVSDPTTITHLAIAVTRAAFSVHTQECVDGISSLDAARMLMTDVISWQRGDLTPKQALHLIQAWALAKVTDQRPGPRVTDFDVHFWGVR